jgi:hypothetical protein
MCFSRTLKASSRCQSLVFEARSTQMSSVTSYWI